MGSLSENPEDWSIPQCQSVHPQGRTPPRGSFIDEIRVNPAAGYQR
jgi:hypothetical protein